jgi:RNA polymerase sigma-70 factor (ECF subfamily)
VEKGEQHVTGLDGRFTEGDGCLVIPERRDTDRQHEGRQFGNFSAAGRHYLTEVEDVGLLERARRGDEDAFSRLFARYQGAIHRYAAHMGGHETADDVVQETFLVVLRQTGRLDAPQSTVAAYLLGIARRLVLRRITSRHDARLEEALDENTITAAPEGPTPLDDLTRTETIEAVRNLVQSLPSAYREVVVLCELQEMDYAAAAQVIQCPIGTVRSRLHRARTLLATKLAATEPRQASRRDETCRNPNTASCG